MTRQTVLAPVLAVIALAMSACGPSASKTGRPTAGISASSEDGAAPSERRCDALDAPEAVVVGSFSTTIGDLRRWLDRGDVKVGDSRWVGRPDDEAVLLCWYDGPVGKSRPPVPGSPSPAAFNRYATLVASTGEPMLVVAGYRDQLEVEAPHP